MDIHLIAIIATLLIFSPIYAIAFYLMAKELKNPHVPPGDWPGY